VPAILAALFVLAVPALARAGASCFTIEDPDQRAYCRAVSSGNVADCAPIADFTLRQTCRARLEGNARPCSSVFGVAERERCERESSTRK
jgi:hypothetical protein